MDAPEQQDGPSPRDAAVLPLATGAAMRQACTEAGIDADGAFVGIPAAAF